MERQRTLQQQCLEMLGRREFNDKVLRSLDEQVCLFEWLSHHQGKVENSSMTKFWDAWKKRVRRQCVKMLGRTSMSFLMTLTPLGKYEELFDDSVLRCLEEESSMTTCWDAWMNKYVFLNDSYIIRERQRAIRQQCFEMLGRTSMSLWMTHTSWRNDENSSMTTCCDA